MSWSSGPMLSGNGEAWVSDGDGVVRITDADVLVDEAQMLTQGYEIDRRSAVESGERDRRLFVRVAQTHPSIVRSLRVLTAELAGADGELARQEIGRASCRERGEIWGVRVAAEKRKN